MRMQYVPADAVYVVPSVGAEVHTCRCVVDVLTIYCTCTAQQTCEWDVPGLLAGEALLLQGVAAMPLAGEREED